MFFYILMSTHLSFAFAPPFFATHILFTAPQSIAFPLHFAA